LEVNTLFFGRLAIAGTTVALLTNCAFQGQKKLFSQQSPTLTRWLREILYFCPPFSNQQITISTNQQVK